MFCALLGSGERLQDHWSSGFNSARPACNNLHFNSIKTTLKIDFSFLTQKLRSERKSTVSKHRLSFAH